MKTLKRIVASLLVVGMMLTFAACGDGGEEKTVTLQADMSDDIGVPATDTMILTAKGDTIQQLKEITEIDLADIDDETKDAFIATMDATYTSLSEGIDGVTCSSKTSGTVYTVELTVDCTDSNTLKAAADAGLIEIEGNASRLSLKATQSGLEAGGYTVVE